jgi:hypothetical protein
VNLLQEFYDIQPIECPHSRFCQRDDRQRRLDVPERLVVGNERAFLTWFYWRYTFDRNSIEPDEIVRQIVAMTHKEVPKS